MGELIKNSNENSFITALKKGEPRKVLFFYHYADLDGHGSLILLQLLNKLNFHNNKDVIEYYSFGCAKTADEIEKYIDRKLYKHYEYTDIIITDVSVSNKRIADKIDKIYKEGINVILLDHHPTALWLNEYEWAEVKPHDIDKSIINSGTSLFYEFLIPYFKYNFDYALGIKKYIWLRITTFVTLVSQYDTYFWEKNNMKRPYDLNLLFKSMQKKDFVELMINNILKLGSYDILDTESIIKVDTMNDVITKEISNASKHMFIYEEYNFKIGCVFATNYASEIGNNLCKEHLDLNCVLMFNPLCKSYSIRSIRNDIDYCKVAKQLGGGGHAKACGFEFKETWDVSIKDTTLISKYDNVDIILAYGAANMINTISRDLLEKNETKIK